MNSIYKNSYVKVDDYDRYDIVDELLKIEVNNSFDAKIGVMIVGICGSNGSTFTASLKAKQNNITWEDKNGVHEVDFLGSIYQYGTIHIGYKSNNMPMTKLIREMIPIKNPNDLIVGGWDICPDDLYISCKDNKIMDLQLVEQMKDKLTMIKPLKSVYYPDFIANNQSSRATNIKNNPSKWEDVESVMKDISNFKTINKLKKVTVIWSASTERFTKEYSTSDELITDIKNNSTDISPSIIFATAAAMSGCIFVNTSPQNTISPAILELAKNNNTFVCGSDLKTGQTKLKSVLVEYLVSSGIKPLSIVSYNHLGNRDGMNLNESDQFKSKETTKKNVIDDFIYESPALFKDSKPDHEIVIKYVPAVGDTKRAIDEYFSELFLNGKNILSIYNLCEDTLLAVPLILDVILFSEFLSRVNIRLETGDRVPFNPNLSLLSFFFKAPTESENCPVINSFFRQLQGIKNFIKICSGIPIDDFVNIHTRL